MRNITIFVVMSLTGTAIAQDLTTETILDTVKTAREKYEADTRTAGQQYIAAIDQMIENARADGRAAYIESLEDIKKDWLRRKKYSNEIWQSQILKYKLRALDAEYSLLLSQAITALTRIGDTDNASDLRRELENQTNTANGRTESEVLSELVGKWLGDWGTTSNKLFLQIDSQGFVSDRQGENMGRIKLIDGKVLCLRKKHAEDYEFILRNGELIVLGYSKKKARDPLAKPEGNSKSHLPDHIAILFRQ